MSNVRFAKIMKAITTPFKLINMIAKGEKSGEYGTYVRGVLVLIVLVLCYINAAPKSLFQWVLTGFIGLVIAGVVLAISDYAIFFIAAFAALATAFPAAIYDKCNVLIKYHTSENAQADDSVNSSGGGIGTGPKAQVGIRYFIERDKRMKVCHARYLGK